MEKGILCRVNIWGKSWKYSHCCDENWVGRTLRDSLCLAQVPINYSNFPACCVRGRTWHFFLCGGTVCTLWGRALAGWCWSAGRTLFRWREDLEKKQSSAHCSRKANTSYQPVRVARAQWRACQRKQNESCLLWGVSQTAAFQGSGPRVMKRQRDHNSSI